MAAWMPTRWRRSTRRRVDADQATATPIVDWNQDGCVDYTEFSAAPYSLFDQLDANHDGKLTPKELAGRRQEPDDRMQQSGGDEQQPPEAVGAVAAAAGRPMAGNRPAAAAARPLSQ